MTASHGPLTTLRNEFRGTLLLPEDPDYEAARMPWNLAVDQRPAMVAVPEDVRDVRAILRFASASGHHVTTQPSGHGAQGALENVILIRPTRFDELAIDVETRSARIGAGVTWGRVLAALDGTGLLALAGSNPEVSVVGLALNGGESMFSRQYGLTATSIEAVELVDGAGQFRRIAANSDHELLWALRGGGGSFGVVTAIEITLFPGNGLYGGMLVFPAHVATSVIATALELAASAPELGIDVGMAQFPDVPQVPEPFRGQTLTTVAIVHIGDETSGAAIVQPLLAVASPIANTLTPFTIGSLAAVAAEPVDPMPVADYGAAIDVSGIDGAQQFVDAFLAGADVGLARASMRPLGGAIAYPPVSHNAVIGAVGASALVSASVLIFDPSLDAARALAPLQAFCEQHRANTMVPSFLGAGTTLADAYDAETIARLVEVKARVDPNNIIRSNRPLQRHDA